MKGDQPQPETLSFRLISGLEYADAQAVAETACATPHLCPSASVARYAETGDGDIKALGGKFTGAHRLRVGDWRVRFRRVQAARFTYLRLRIAAKPTGGRTVESGLPILLRLFFSSRAALIAENLFLRKQLALFTERKVKPRRTTLSIRVVMVALARFFAWRDALVIVKPETFLKWHRKVFRAFWTWKSRRVGRPPLPKNIRDLVRQMAVENPMWGEERISNELFLKLGVRVSPRTVAKYLKGRRPHGGNNGQHWSTFVRNHAKAIVACDFFISVTASFQLLYVFVAMEIGSRRILHTNVTAHPTAEWTTQQFREFLAFDHPYAFLIHDRDSIFSANVDQTLKDCGIHVLKTPVRSPTANAWCERLIGTIRRECLDYIIPINERHLRRTVTEFGIHYNRGRPHSSLGPGIPEPPQAKVPASVHRHKIPAGYRVTATSVLGGLHHEYSLEKEAA